MPDTRSRWRSTRTCRTEEPNGRHVEPRQSAELVWRFTKAGTFEFACPIPGHYETGMEGVVVVK